VLGRNHRPGSKVHHKVASRARAHLAHISSNPRHHEGHRSRTTEKKGGTHMSWKAGLLRIIALASGESIGRIKPGVTYRRDPLRRGHNRRRWNRETAGTINNFIFACGCDSNRAGIPAGQALAGQPRGFRRKQTQKDRKGRRRQRGVC